MPDISLTDFIDIAGKAGTPKATKIAEVKNRPAYNPSTDFYKKLRSWIVTAHQQNKPKSHLDSLMSQLAEPKKQVNYAAAVSGYKKWWGKKTITWFSPPKAEYLQSGIAVSVNPELGLEIDGKRHVIKLYFKSEQANKLRIAIVTELMSISLGAQCQNGDVLALLDVRNAKLFPVGPKNAVTVALIDAELAYIAAIWPKL
jgi:hypothetical protein